MQLHQSIGMPKFNTPAWYSLGILLAIVLIVDAAWSIVAQYSDPFFPFHVGRIFRIAIGLGLGLHCLDMLAKNRLRGNRWFIDRLHWYMSAIRFAWSSKSFRIGVLACTSGIVIGLMAGIGTESLVLLVAIALIGWGLEVANSAIETVLDIVHPGDNPKVKVAKDAFGAVPAFTYTAFTISWIILVVPTLYDMLVTRVFTIGN